MGFGDGANDGEAEAAAFASWPRAVEWIEDLRREVRRQTRTDIFDLKDDGRPDTLRDDVERTWSGMFFGVVDQSQRRLAQTGGIAANLR